MTFDRDEVEAAFRTYWQLGAVGEDWDAWCDTCFTEDVTYIEHILGNKQGTRGRAAWIKPTMADYGEIYTAYEWHMIDDNGRVVVYMQNRRDNPEPGAPPIDFPGMTVLQYAGDGQFSLGGRLLVASRRRRDLQAVRRPVQEVRPRLPAQAHSAQLGQRPGLGPGRSDLRRVCRRGKGA